MPCSRQTSRTDRSPRIPANTISSFCCAVQLRYFLCSLNPVSLSVERPILSPTPDSLSGGYAPSEAVRPKSANRQHASGERSTIALPLRAVAGLSRDHAYRQRPVSPSPLTISARSLRDPAVGPRHGYVG